ncbi:MAG: Rieske 2Fe-2S domain-containing protein [Candidatus Latescibacteria bacterium]|nr:Rieske 2Fe-2S domain-containing protein [Candidatus Latescibacterota bacterium]
MASSDIGAVGDFASGQPQRVEVAGRALVVVRSGERFYALRDTCPHQGAPLSGGKVGGTSLPCLPGDEIGFGQEGELLTCPWHGWQFELATGRALVEPERFRVRAYPVRVVEGRVLVEMG